MFDFWEVIAMQEIVRNIMSKNVVAVLPNDTAEDAAKLMSENDIGSIPVISNGRLEGLLTDRDIVIRCISKEKNANATKVSDLMSKNVAFVTPEQSVHEAVSMMAAERVRRLPVVKDGVVNGMISLADIARIHSGPEIASALTEISSKNTC